MAYRNSVATFFTVHLLLLFSAEGRAKVPAIIVFGDSTVDAGNNNYILTVMRANFKPYGQDFEGGKPTGRFSNGRLFTDFISDALGLKPSIPAYLDPSFGIEDFATGVTFASAGTGYDNLTAQITHVLPLWKQLEYFKDYRERLTRFQGKDKANKTLHEALYMISIGTNDFILNYFVLPIRRLQYDISGYEKLLAHNSVNFIKDLYNLGARKISISGPLHLGCLPATRNLDKFGRRCFGYYNQVTRDYNKELLELLDKLRKEVDDIQVVYSDIYNPMENMTRNPSSFGLKEVKRGCCGTGLVETSYSCMLANSLSCKDPSKYLYWDAIHPTDKANGVIADSVMKTSLHELI